jgi:hypothetical protein
MRAIFMTQPLFSGGLSAEPDVHLSCARDPLVIMENAALRSSEMKGTQEVRGNAEPVM